MPRAEAAPLHTSPDELFFVDCRSGCHEMRPERQSPKKSRLVAIRVFSPKCAASQRLRVSALSSSAVRLCPLRALCASALSSSIRARGGAELALHSATR